LDFGEGPEVEKPQGPKLVNRRLSSGCWERLDGVTYQKQVTTKKCRQHHAIRMGKKE
jgi:hypothetical protein